jgi:hypothetical protein
MKCDFEFVCKKEWYELAEVNNEGVEESSSQFQTRFCTTCQKNVHRVDTEEELKAAISNGLCIAVSRFDKVKIRWFKKLIENSRTVGVPRKFNDEK